MASAPYDLVNDVITTAGVRLNDAIETLLPVGGQLLNNTQPFTQAAVNIAWRKMQEFLANLGYATLTDRVVILNLVPTTATDVSTEVYIGWTGYFDGTTLQASPALPQNLIFPYWVKERIHGSNAPFGPPMEEILDGLPSLAPQVYNFCWEWRGNSIYLPGANTALDIEVRYGKYLPDFADTGSGATSVPWFAQPVPIMRALDAFSFYLCAEMAEARSADVLIPKFIEKAEAAAKLIMNRDIRQKQRVNVRRRSRSGRLEAGYGGYGYGWG